jgi:hypothetical protein
MVVCHNRGNDLSRSAEEWELTEQLCDIQLTFNNCCWGESEAACLLSCMRGVKEFIEQI